MTSLTILYLNDTDVTDAGLEHLKKLTNLDILHLGGTNVTDAGIADLKKSLSQCRISK